tara:strand:+ start:4369 stop:4902 length:534 start_codon:yes stop_codon:yes gene_type:complete
MGVIVLSNQPNIVLDQHFYPRHTHLFSELLESVEWDERIQARKMASFGTPYDYSQLSYDVAEMLPCLVDVAECLKERLDISFNNCLLNLYETGKNTMGFHSDDISKLLPGTGVAIVSLGNERTITFRSTDQLTYVDFTLKPGSLLYMDNNVQNNWMHAIKKQSSAQPRISLTWRAIP